MRARSSIVGFSLAALVIVAVVSAHPRTGGGPPILPSQAAQAPVCSKTWIGHEAEMEVYLRTAPIERIEDVPIGVTKPKRAFFRGDGPMRSAAWKPLRAGLRGGFWESYQAEIAAYELDKLLGLQMVPPSVERRVEGELGAIIQWVDGTRSWKIREPVVGPDLDAWNRQVIAMKMFDNLIGNADRNQGNLIYDSEYHLILIDHSRAFTDDTRLPVKLSRVWKDLYDRMNALTLHQLEPVLAKYMGKRAIKAVVTRRDRMRDEVEKMAARPGPGVFVN
jgi:hypothetical protein